MASCIKRYFTPTGEKFIEIRDSGDSGQVTGCMISDASDNSNKFKNHVKNVWPYLSSNSARVRDASCGNAGSIQQFPTV